MQSSQLSCGFSTCPNDTFIFCHMAKEPDIEVCLDDVESLNREAFRGRFDITKLSFHAWLMLQEVYELLPVGAALGRGCGPMIISGGCDLDEQSTVAVPGEYTTAHLLLRLRYPQISKRIFMPFDRIMDAVESGEADAGVIIHEGRFVYGDRGFQCLEDLGDWWEKETGLPIPLGCIAVRKSLGAERMGEIAKRLKESINKAFTDPSSTDEYVRQYAQEMDNQVIRQHIETYVNDFTLDLGEEGRAAIERLQELALQAGIIS